MSTLKSSAEHLTLNADGSGNDIKFQSNATQVAAIDQSGNLTLSGTVDGVDIATRDAILTSTTTTAGAALPKAGGAMTGKLLIGDSNSHTTDLLQIETPASGGGHGIQIRRNDSNNDQGVGHILFGNNTAIDLASISAKTDGATDSGAILFNTSVTSGANTERMRIDASGNVGIGVTPSGWPSSGDFTALQIGTGAAVYGRGSGDEAKSGLTANAYLDTTNDRFEYIGNSYASHYRQNDGNHTFWTAPSGSANGAITFTNVLDIGRDGKVSTWQGSGMTSHFNVGNRDIDVGTSTGYANRQERIGLMAADPWGTAAGIYLSVSRNTNQDGRSHPSLHFTGNHGAGQSEDYLIMSMNSSFYGTESVNVGSSANDANLEVNGHLSALKQPSFWASGTVASGNNLQASNVEFVFSNAQSNVGNHYSTSTGRFTAPVAGAYLFSGTVSSNSIGSYRWTIKKNNTQIQAGGGSNDNVPHGLNSRDEASTCTIILQLAANDYVSCSVRSGQTCMLYGGHSYFSGVLVG